MSGFVIDTSAMVAVLTGEPGADWLATRMNDADVRSMSAPTFVELGIVLEARVPTAVGIAHRALRDARIEVQAFDDDLAERAIEAWRRFGKGRHRAGLNFADCCTYALAARSGDPILCTGDDFARTDLPVARPEL